MLPGYQSYVAYYRACDNKFAIINCASESVTEHDVTYVNILDMVTPITDMAVRLAVTPGGTVAVLTVKGPVEVGSYTSFK